MSSFAKSRNVNAIQQPPTVGAMLPRGVETKAPTSQENAHSQMFVMQQDEIFMSKASTTRGYFLWSDIVIHCI